MTISTLPQLLAADLKERSVRSRRYTSVLNSKFKGVWKPSMKRALPKPVKYRRDRVMKRLIDLEMKHNCNSILQIAIRDR